MRPPLAPVVLLLLAVTAPVSAAPPDVETIVARMKQALEPGRSSTRTLTIVVNEKSGETARWTAGQARKRVGEANRILTVLLAPESVRGVAMLVEEGGMTAGRQWLYLPVVRRVREIVPVESYQSFLNTDFTYADLGFTRRAGTDKLLGTETRDNLETYRVEEVPRATWYYSRIVTWVAADSWLPVRREFYDPDGVLWKAEKWAQVTAIDGVAIPMSVVMEDVRQGGSTEVRVSDVLWDCKIPDDAFDPDRLGTAGNAALWTPAGR